MTLKKQGPQRSRRVFELKMGEQIKFTKGGKVIPLDEKKNKIRKPRTYHYVKLLKFKPHGEEW